MMLSPDAARKDKAVAEDKETLCTYAGACSPICITQTMLNILIYIKNDK